MDHSIADMDHIIRERKVPETQSADQVVQVDLKDLKDQQPRQDLRETAVSLDYLVPYLMVRMAQMV